MAYPKTELFSDFDQKISAYGRSLGHPARVEILRLLKDHGPMQVMDLVKILPLSEGAITAHLKKLKEADLVSVEIDRLMNYYSLHDSGLVALLQMQSNLFVRLGVTTDGMDFVSLTHGVAVIESAGNSQ